MSRELQTLTSSRDMSATESFSSTPVQAQTDVDVTVPVGPLYQTLTDANVDHRQYHTDQVKSTVPQPTGYATPNDPLPPNEYDLINEKQVLGQGGVAHPPNRRLEADNVLYAGQKEAEEQFKHATLHMDRDSNRYSGNIHSPLMEPDEKTGICSGKIRLMFLVFFLFATIMIAVAALALAVVLLLGVHPVPCDCESSLTGIETRLQIIEDKLDVPSPNGSDDDGGNAIADLQSAVNNLTSEVSSLSSRVDQSVMQGSNVTLSVHDGCNTTMEGTCTVAALNASPVFNGCLIPDPGFFSLTQLGSEDYYIADIQCRRIGISSEQNPFVATLQENNGQFRCICYVIAPVAGINFSESVDCAMFVTRCPLTQDFIIST